jgi:heat shock protein HslJ
MIQRITAMAVLAVAAAIAVVGSCRSGPQAERTAPPVAETPSQQAAPDRPLGSWSLAAFGDGGALVAGTKVEVEFTANGHVRGHGGCNQFFGDFTVEEEGRIAAGPFGATRMACPPPVMEQESRFLGALEQAESFRVSSGNLELSDADGKILVVLSRL